MFFPLNNQHLFLCQLLSWISCQSGFKVKANKHQRHIMHIKIPALTVFYVSLHTGSELTCIIASWHTTVLSSQRWCISKQHSLSGLKRPGHCTFTTSLNYKICFCSFEAVIMTMGEEKPAVETENPRAIRPLSWLAHKDSLLTLRGLSAHPGLVIF